MPAYLIGHITVNDPDKWKTYVDGVQKYEATGSDSLFGAFCFAFR